MTFGQSVTMPTGDYREWLLVKANDAAQRARSTEDPDVRAAWQRIETNYRKMAGSLRMEDAANGKSLPAVGIS
jgi:hypothetical protein